jgi:hypothetical protein
VLPQVWQSCFHRNCWDASDLNDEIWDWTGNLAWICLQEGFILSFQSATVLDWISRVGGSVHVFPFFTALLLFKRAMRLNGEWSQNVISLYCDSLILSLIDLSSEGSMTTEFSFVNGNCAGRTKNMILQSDPFIAWCQNGWFFSHHGMTPGI